MRASVSYGYYRGKHWYSERSKWLKAYKGLLKRLRRWEKLLSAELVWQIEPGKFEEFNPREEFFNKHNGKGGL